MSFQEMQVDTQPFPINTIELARKRVLVRLEVAIKGKGKNIIIGDPRTSNVSHGGVARKAPDKKTNKSGGTEGACSIEQSSKGPCLKHRGLSGTYAWTVRCSCRRSDQPNRTVRPWPEASASTQSKEGDAGAKHM